MILYLFFIESLDTCSSGKRHHQDECMRQCHCVNKKLKHCYRVRKEFSKLNLRDRKFYINAYILLSTLPQYHRKFKGLTQLHFQAFYKGLHSQVSQFLPWHRK